MGHSVTRLRDFNDYDSSPFSGRRPSSHTAYLPDQVSPSQAYAETHLPSFHHDHLHHAGQDIIGVSTLQPNTQRRERAREALMRRNCEHNVSIESGQSHSGSSRTTENPTEQTVVVRGQGGARLLSAHSLHSAHSGSVRCDEDQNSDSHLSSEDNLSHESYDLLDKEEEAHMNTYSENIKTVLSRSEISFDNSLSYSIPHTPSKIAAIDDNVIHDIEQSRHSSYREDLINSNLNSHSKPNSHSSTYSSLSASPLPEQQMAQARRRSSGSGTLSQRSKNSKDSLKSESRMSLREGHFLSEDCSDGFHGHEIHMESGVSASPHLQTWPEKLINQNHQPQTARDSPVLDVAMHENIIFQSPTNMKYFSPQIQQQAFSSRTLPNRRRREKSPVVFTTGKLSVDCSSASSSSQASPRMCRPKSLDFSVVALQDLPQTDAYSYRDDTIEQNDFEDNSSSTFSVQNNYASSSDVPQTPELGAELASSLSSRTHISGKPIPTFSSSKHQSFPFHGLKQERIYDIPEGIEREDISITSSKETRSVFQNVGNEKQKSYKNYLEITRKFSSEESESTSHKPKLKILPPPRVLKKVSSTESESAISNNSHQSLPPVQFDSDTLSLPLDLISPPLESESSTALVESESLPAPPQFGSNKDDTDIEDEVTPRGEETISESQDHNPSHNFSLEQPEKSKFGFRVAPPALQALELVPPTRQESTYESRAEKMLESQLSRMDTFTEDLSHRTREILDLDKQSNNGNKMENVLLKALDSYDSFSNDQFQISSVTSGSRQESLTYEENAESALEKQTTIESFTSQMSDDNEVFYDQSIENKIQELNDPNFTNRRDQILESQSTFESFTTECEVLVTKRQESTYEERAETVLESQNTIESFTNEVPNDEVFDHEPQCSESSFLHDNCETQIEKTDNDLVADMFVRHLREPGCESDIDNVPFMDDSFDQDLVISSGGKVACGQGDTIIYNNFVKFPTEESVETVIVESAPSGETIASPEESLTGAYDTEAPPPLPPDDFGSFTVPHEPLYYRADGFRGSFPMRTLSRISEKSSNESASTPSDTPAVQYDHSDHEQNYTTSEDNENAPSISSDLAENMAAEEDSVIPNPLEELHVEFGCDSSQEESLKNTECTQLDQDTLEDEEEEDLDETNAEEIKTEERDLPPDFRPELTNSITSENEVTNKDSDGSLHDSMEILEEVNTEDRFDHDPNRCSFEGSEESQRQIQWRVTIPKSNIKSCQASSKPTLLKKPSVSLSENSGKYVVTEGSEEVIL